MRPIASAADAAWLVSAMTTFGGTVGDVAPRGFEAYARVFHPVASGTWEDIAASAGRVMHPAVRWERIAPDASHRPAYGSLGLRATRVLAGVLAAHTTTPDRCFFAVWEGWGGLEVDPAAAMLSLPGRNYLLHGAPVSEAAYSFEWFPDRQASLWWPADRSWFVASEIDFDSTVVAGSRQLVDAVLASPLEALEVTAETDLSSLGDLVNG